jgi:hypothetical protein
MSAPVPATSRLAPPRKFGLSKEVKSYHNVKPIPPRRHGVHPSALPTLCPVKFTLVEWIRAAIASEDPEQAAQALALLQKVNNDPVHGASPGGRFKGELLQEFRAGSDIHRNVQFDLGVTGRLWGKWRCPRCRWVSPEGWMPRAWYPGKDGSQVLDAAPCVQCSGRNKREDWPWLYVEPAVTHWGYGIIGHYDGDLRVTRGETWRLLLEIKSINENGYMEKYGVLPNPAHVLQASVYAWLGGFSWICFIYVDKNQVHKWKEIIVPVDTEAISEVVAKLEAIKWARENRQLPLAARVCEDIRCKTARGCPLVYQCWGETPPPNFWGDD